MSIFSKITEHPYYQKYQSLKADYRTRTEPIRRRWRAFDAAFPTAAKWIRRFGRVTGSIFAIIFAVWFMAIVGVFGHFPSYKELRTVRTATASEAYTTDGVLLGRYFQENRTNVEFKEISKPLVEALIATEDVRFFEHNGVDLRSFFRVAFKSVLMGDESSGGGSTLSQQLAKNLFRRKKYWILSLPVNKIREMIIAQRLERIYSKEELLAMYYNTVPFGNNVFGVSMASFRYFGKKPKDITVTEAAMLVGMLKATTSYNPIKNPEKALQRRNTVLSQMVRYNFLTQNSCDTLEKKPLTLNFSTRAANQDFAPYFREQVRQDAENILKNYKKPDSTAYDLYTDGLKIYTTLDSRMQHYAEEAVREHLTKLQVSFEREWGSTEPWEDNPDFLENEVKNSRRYRGYKEQGLSEKEIDKIFRTKIPMKMFSWKGDVEKMMSPLDSIRHYYHLISAGFMVMEPQTGSIKAWVGGSDYDFFQFDHVRSRRQVGSTFKPIVYARALQGGISPVCEYFPNQHKTYKIPKKNSKGKVVEIEEWTPSNSDNEYGGYYNMPNALMRSINAITINLIMRDSVGVDSVKALAEKMGVISPILPVPSIALGTADISLFEMMQVYGTFANRGLRPKPTFITKIETADGKLLAEFKPEINSKLVRALSEDDADLMVMLLKKVVENGTASRLRRKFDLKNELAGKTGTSQNQADGWFMGFSPKLVAGVWAGAESPSVHFRSMETGQGASAALPIWGLFMKKLYADPKFEHYSRDSFPHMGEGAKLRMKCPIKEPDSLELDTLHEILEEGITPEQMQKILDQNLVKPSPPVEKKPDAPAPADKKNDVPPADLNPPKEKQEKKPDGDGGRK